ncbi:MAG: M3 family oligoendopeptidase [Planctomycetota bacterium]
MPLPALPPELAAARTFVPADLDCADWDQLEPLYRQLLGRDLDTAAAIGRWLADYSELAAVVGEYASRRNIDHACHTDDAEIEAAYLHWVEQISSKLKPLGNELQRKYLDAPALSELDPDRYDILTREWRASAELFREANVPLQTEVAKLNSEYDKLVGAMLVEFDGRTQTLQQLARYQEETDRGVRQEAWTLAADRRLKDRDAIDDIFQQMFERREQMATNADCANYLQYSWKSWQRFDYTPQDCEAFADAIEAAVMPRVAALDEQRRAALGVETLRPWDAAVDVAGRSPLRPFAADDVERMVSGTSDIFRRIDPSLAEDFDRLRFGANLDLDSRRGKRAGGFQSSLTESREPFIFMNAAGLQRDVDTLLHEGGHAFHYQWASRAEPLVFLQHAPIEFCEVASMSMELMGADHYGVFYADEAEAARAKRKQFEGILRFFPWMATIDMFQHWLYTHPGHGLAERTEAWQRISGRFTSAVVDWSGLEDAFAARWHAQLHLFHIPFYYVEYGIAQLGALQLWKRYRDDPAAALADYRAGLTLGGTRPLPELFAAAGIRFDFSRASLEPLINAVADELDRLPA